MSDLIDRKSVIDAITNAADKFDWPDDYHHEMKEGIRIGTLICSLIPSKQPEQQWIPITEKFPQEDEDVLLQFSSNQCVGYYEDGDWMINTGDGIYCIIGYNEEKPIAWMPLPEPYKEDDHEIAR